MNKINRKYLLLFAITIMFFGIGNVLAVDCSKNNTQRKCDAQKEYCQWTGTKCIQGDTNSAIVPKDDGNSQSDGCMKCGDALIPNKLVVFSAKLIGFIQIIVPIIIIVTGMIELLKAIIASDEKKMDESKGSLIRKFIAGIAIFLVFVIVKFAFNLLGNVTANEYLNCATCFINEDCSDKKVVTCPSRTDYENGVSTDDSKESGSANGKSDDNGSSSNSDVVKNCADRGSISECNSDSNCKWSYQGNYCEANNNGNSSQNVNCNNLPQKKCLTQQQYCQWTGTACIPRD